jgi:ankyrin repeat protein
MATGLPELPDAANRNDAAAVRALLARGGIAQADLDLALARAVLSFAQRREIAELLIAHGADPNGQYGGDYGPIVLVTGECLDPDGLEFLLRHGADVSFAPIPSKYGPTSPLIATLGSHARGANGRKHRCIALLLAHGAVLPAEVTPEMLAIHRGDPAALAAALDGDPDLVHRRFPAMPYGNLRLAGGTLLHLAVECGDLPCVELLLGRGAFVNARGQMVDGLGGETPLFHAVATLHGAGLPVLERLTRGGGHWIDRDASARFAVFGEPIPRAMTALEYAEWSLTGPSPGCRASERELALLRGLARPLVEDPEFAQAVAAIDAGDLDGLRALLARAPRLATARAEEPGAFAGPYFAHPALLWFVAENPIRTGRLAPNIAAIADAIIAAGTAKADIDHTLGLVTSGMVARREGRQLELIDLLVARGADAAKGLRSAIQEREYAAARRLIALGAVPDLAAAAGLGDLATLRRLLGEGAHERSALIAALGSAAQAGHDEAIALLVAAGAPVDARLDHGATALHQAAYGGHRTAVERLLALGADPTLVDGRFSGTAAGWAEHAGHPELAALLRTRGPRA